MGLQLLFCVEADRKSGTDWVYIKSVIDKYFSIDNSISIKPVYMGGKTNFKRNKVVNEINRASKEFEKNGETVVIYCIDEYSALGVPPIRDRIPPVVQSVPLTN